MIHPDEGKMIIYRPEGRRNSAYWKVGGRNLKPGEASLPAEELRAQVIDVLQLVAADAQTQRRVLPSFVHVPDEVAHNSHVAAIWGERLRREELISEAAYSKIKALERALGDLIGDARLGGLDAFNGPEWEHVRGEARRLLLEMGLSPTRPALHWMKFVSGGDQGGTKHPEEAESKRRWWRRSKS